MKAMCTHGSIEPINLFLKKTPACWIVPEDSRPNSRKRYNHDIISISAMQIPLPLNLRDIFLGELIHHAGLKKKLTT
jgi:hypothetical protein